MKKWTHRHNFESDGSQCTICGYTMVEIMDKNKKRKRIDQLDDDDVPTTKGDEHPRGFWGNKTTGYTTDKENE